MHRPLVICPARKHCKVCEGRVIYAGLTVGKYHLQQRQLAEAEEHYARRNFTLALQTEDVSADRVRLFQDALALALARLDFHTE